MKKLFILFAIILFAFTGCSKDDDDGIGKFDYDKELLYGTWKVTHAGGISWNQQTTTATFYSDGTYSGRGYFGTGSGTYKLSGSKVTCYVDGAKFMWYDVLSLNETECRLIASDNSGSITITCKKQ